MVPHIARIETCRDAAEEWAETARRAYGDSVRVNVCDRTVSALGLSAVVWVVVLWPRGTREGE
jgi:hypothetical protein